MPNVHPELKNANDALLQQMEEQRRTEEALQKTQSELARVVRITTIGELTASIAHEVNQPLAAIVANADACVAWLGLQSPDLVEARAAAERTIQGATRASEVITRIRSLISKAAPDRTLVQLNEIIEESVALAESQASRNDVSVELNLAPGLPRLPGDRIQLQQVILNLMLNGIESMSGVAARPRRLLIRSFAQQPDGITVAIEDQGIGVSAENMARLFEPFFTTRSQGIGMGLAISRSIIEAHGGRLWGRIHSESGFDISVHSSRWEWVFKMREQDPIVFVIDDDSLIRDGIQSLIRSIGLRAQTFASALEFVQAKRPDAPACLVLDVRMPGLSGLELQRQLSEAEIHIPIIFITGHGDIPMSVRAMKDGATESTPESRMEWIASLELVKSLDPIKNVVAGHKYPGRTDDPATVDDSIQYLTDFIEAERTTITALELYEAVLAASPSPGQSRLLVGCSEEDQRFSHYIA